MMHQPNIFGVELTCQNLEKRLKIYLSLQKSEQNSPFSYHTLLFYVYPVKLELSGQQSFYFMINYFAIERNEEMTSKKCCESKYYYILYNLQFLLEMLLLLLLRRKVIFMLVSLLNVF